MKKLKIIKFDTNMAICEDSEKKLFGIAKSELPKEVKSGCVITIDDNGTLIVDKE